MPYFQPRLSLPNSLDFKNKTILITGASAGLGLATTELVLLRGAKEVIAGVRSISREEAVKAEILSKPEVKKANPDARITILHLDLEDYDSVVAFSEKIKQQYNEKLDIALLNAGTASLKWQAVAKTGHERTIQVNVLSTALLAVELLPTLRSTAQKKGVPSRLTGVGSFVQFDHTLNKKPVYGPVLQHFDDEKNWGASTHYSDSKLLGTLFVEKLANYVDPSEVIINEVSPGMVRTLFGDFPVWFRMIFIVLFYFKGRTPSEGAKTYLHAMGVAGKESHGKYLSDNQITDRAPFVATSEGRRIQESLWEEMWQDFAKIDKNLERPSSHR